DEQALGNVLVEEGRLEDASRRFQVAESLGHPEASAALGDVLRRLGRTDEALEILEDAARRRPESVYARRGLAVLLAESGRLIDAQREFEAALSIDANDWESLSGLGNVLLHQGRAEEALARYRAALELHPGFES